MRFLYKGFDGGPDSPVIGYWLIEIKCLFSITLLKFKDGARENFHTHAFNALTWFLCGDLIEERIINDNLVYKRYRRSLIPKLTRKDNLHRVSSYGTSWCLSIRGPWAKTWKEYNIETKQYTTLTNGRKIVGDSLTY